MKRFSLALALLSAPLFASSTTILEAPRHAADLFLTGSQFQAENPGPRASWLVFSDSRGTVLTTTRIPAGTELTAEVPASLLYEVNVEVLTLTARGIHRGERTPLSLLPPDPTPAIGAYSTSDQNGSEGDGTQFAAHGGGGNGGGVGATPPEEILPPLPPL